MAALNEAYEVLSNPGSFLISSRVLFPYDTFLNRN
jgi:hypothetical protein